MQPQIKRGRPVGSGSGRTSIGRSLNLPPALWARLAQAARAAGISRSKFIHNLIDKALQ